MYTAKISLWQIFQLSIFVLNREKYHYPGKISNFRFSSLILFYFRSKEILNDSVY